jgi:hypothetical protein
MHHIRSCPWKNKPAFDTIGAWFLGWSPGADFVYTESAQVLINAAFSTANRTHFT